MIPVFDLRDYDADPAAFAAAFGKAFHDFGFVRVRGHGISKDIITQAEENARQFFRKRPATKDRHQMHGNEGLIGYSRNHETARGQDVPDMKEQWNIRARLPSGHPLAGQEQKILTVPRQSSFKPSMMSLYSAFEDLTARVVKPLAVYMGEDEAFFDDKLQDSLSMMRLLHYPKAGSAANHLDLNFLTWLRADEPGLFVTARDGHEYAVVAESDDELILNGGMMLGLMTNNDLKPSWHRVEAHSPRQTIVFFVHPNPDVILTPLKKFNQVADGVRPDYFPPAGADGRVAVSVRDFVTWQIQQIHKPKDAPKP